ncbi:MAG: quercetin 2,3-dioxygenase [Acidobacteriia bacterium]|nr:quercetin 2,3-dioxygenase [Terriglobia bacterium]
MSDRTGIAVVEATAAQADGFAAAQFEPILMDAGGGHTFTMLGTSMRFLATAASTGGRYTVLEQVTPPGWGPPRHIHSREDEIFYILEGSYELHVGRERRTVSAGASAVLPRGIPHGFRNVASTHSRLLCVITPGGFEEYFLAVARCSPPPSPAQLIELARPFGLSLLPPGA